MIKFKITPERFTEACNILQYLAVTNNDLRTAIQIAPRFVVNEKDEYLVKVILDEDGDIKDLENVGEALLLMTQVTPKRLEKLHVQLMEAAKAIVNPQSAEGLNTPMSTDIKKPPAG